MGCMWMSWLVNNILTYCLYRELEIPTEASSLADSKDFELKMYGIGASAEETRPPRKVKVAVVQNAIVKPTTDPIEEQVCTCMRPTV